MIDYEAGGEYNENVSIAGWCRGMKREDKTEQALERIKQRLDGIEKMLTMLLMSDVISEYADGVCLDITDEVKAILDSVFHSGPSTDRQDQPMAI